MNKNENIDVVKRFYAAQIPLDLDLVISLTTPDVHWSARCFAANVIAGKNTSFDGQGELRKLFNSIDSDVEFESTEFKQFLGEGDKVVVLARSRWKNKKTEKTAEYDWIRVFTIRDGKIASQEGFDCTASVLHAFS